MVRRSMLRRTIRTRLQSLTPQPTRSPTRSTRAVQPIWISPLTQLARRRPQSPLIPQRTALYAVNAGSNSIAVIPLSGPFAFRTIGLIPTAYDPTDVAFSADGSWMYIINGKSDTGPNPGYGYGNFAFIQYITPPGGPFPGGNAAESAKLTGKQPVSISAGTRNACQRASSGWRETSGT